MRVRNKPWAKDTMAEHREYVILEPETMKGKWQAEFNNDHPVHLEVGTGKGQFIIEMARRNPDTNFIGLELQDSVLVMALEKALEGELLPNLRFILGNALELSSYFEEGEVAKLFLNFSDPWPKARHAKRRLTFKTFLDQYKHVLQTDGLLQFKTDNQGLFEYSLTSMSQYGMDFLEISLNLHESDIEGNVQTEYEEKFSARGFRINYMLAKFK
ncbi:tRNA (guanosine(46)-N7)-methyltransferase TrmB [Aerococcaceae bacterium 50-4]